MDWFGYFSSIYNQHRIIKSILLDVFSRNFMGLLSLGLDLHYLEEVENHSFFKRYLIFPICLKTLPTFWITFSIVTSFTWVPLVYIVSKHRWEIPASDYIWISPAMTPKLWLFGMPVIQNYLLDFRRASQSYKTLFLSKSSSGSREQNNTLMIQLTKWAKPDFTMRRNYEERPQNLLQFCVCTEW